MTFENTDIKHFHACASTLVRYKENLQYCDVSLNIGGVEFPAHKVILAMFSPYFEALFSGDFIESNDKVIELKGMDPTAFESVLDYIYTGKVANPHFAITEVYKIADYLQIDELKYNCYMVLADAVPFDQCVAVIKLTESHHLPGILEEALLIFNECLDEISQTNGFLELNIDAVIKLLNTCESTEDQATKMFNAAMSWLKHDLDARKKHLGSFLDIMPVQCINRTLLDTVILKESVICEDAEASSWVLSNFPVVQLNDNENDSIDNNATFYIPSKFKQIFVKHRDSEFVSFETVTKEFRRLAPVPTFQDLKPVTYKDEIFLFGGINSEIAYKYNMLDREWKSIPFPSYTSSEMPCVLGDSVYFTGGFFNDTGYNSVCRYHFDTGRTQNYPNLNFDRSLYGVASNDNCIFVCGGMNYTLRNTPKLRHVEGMDIREGKWSILHPMDEVQGPCTAAYISDSLYVSNAHSGRTERFNTRSGKWELLTDAPWGSGMIVEFDNRLYRIYSEGVAEYLPRSDQWQIVGKYDFDSPAVVSF